MIAPPGESLKVVLYEGPGSHPMNGDYRREVLAALLDAGYAVARTGPAGQFASDGKPLAVLGLFGGKAPELPNRDGEDLFCRDLAGRCSCAALAAAEEIRNSLGLPEPRRWTPWFPVLDYDRCAGCRQCANFCIFGVYRVDEAGKVLVAAPGSCKTNCPACARMCPKLAIIFPKYGESPIDGAEVRPEDLECREGQAALKDLAAGDAYAILRQRSGAIGAWSAAARPTSADLARLADRAGIPPEVLASLGVAEGQGPGKPCGCGGPAPVVPAAPNCDCPCPGPAGETACQEPAEGDARG